MGGREGRGARGARGARGGGSGRVGSFMLRVGVSVYTLDAIAVVHAVGVAVSDMVVYIIEPLMPLNGSAPSLAPRAAKSSRSLLSSSLLSVLWSSLRSMLSPMTASL